MDEVLDFLVLLEVLDFLVEDEDDFLELELELDFFMELLLEDIS